MRQVLTVPEALAGVLLQDFLAQSRPDVDRKIWRRLQQQQAVKVNGMEQERNVPLRAFDYIKVECDEGDLVRRREPATVQGLLALYESEHALVVDKPAGLLTVPDRLGQEPSVHSMLADLRPGADLRIVHRLDRDTSGCLLLAKGAAAAAFFDACFRERRVHKSYLALVHGVVLHEQQTVDLAVGEDPRRPGRMRTAAGRPRGFRAAQTLVQRLSTGLRHSLLQLSPQTGRTHQLRVHLQAIGHPITGDLDYGGAPLLLSELKRRYKLRPGVAERPLLDRMFLHSDRLELSDCDGAPIVAASPLPKNLQTALAKAMNSGAARSREE